MSSSPSAAPDSSFHLVHARDADLDRDADGAIAADDERLARRVVSEWPALDSQRARLALRDDEHIPAEARAQTGV